MKIDYEAIWEECAEKALEDVNDHWGTFYRWLDEYKDYSIKICSEGIKPKDIETAKATLTDILILSTYMFAAGWRECADEEGI